LSRNIAAVLHRSGCEDVPDWMLKLKKPNSRRLKQLKVHPPKRKCIQQGVDIE